VCQNAALGLQWLMTQQELSVEQDVLNATILERFDLTQAQTIVRVRPDSGVVPEFVAGQFIKLGLPRSDPEEVQGRPRREGAGPRLIRRAYSIASSSRERAYLEFLLVLVEVGKLTPKIWNIEAGGRIWMEDKVAGRFTLDAVPPGKDVVMVATGTGIAPFISMLRTYADQPPWRRAVVINGVRYAADLAYRDELEILARQNARVTYIPIVSREPESRGAGGGWTGLRGRVQQVLEPRAYESLVGAPLAPHDCHVMLCGNPEMIVSVQRLLEAGGFHTHSTAQPGNIHFERYW
jgi:ferredoxin--NADP+ reductase